MYHHSGSIDSSTDSSFISRFLDGLTNAINNTFEFIGFLTENWIEKNKDVESLRVVSDFRD